MSLSRPVTLTPEDVVIRELRKIKDRLRRLENQHSPTVPIYNPDFPTDAVDGQFALASTPPEDLAEDSEAIPYFRWDTAWHPFSAGANQLRWAWVNQSSFTVNTTDTGYFPWTGGGLTYPVGLDPTVFELETGAGPPNGVKILKDGLYLIRHVLAWQGDWNPCVLETSIWGGSSAVFPSVLGWAYDSVDRQSVYMGEGDGRFSFFLVSDAIVSVTEVSGDVFAAMIIHNDFAGNADRDTEAAQLILRLSSSTSPDGS